MAELQVSVKHRRSEAMSKPGSSTPFFQRVGQLRTKSNDSAVAVLRRLPGGNSKRASGQLAKGAVATGSVLLGERSQLFAVEESPRVVDQQLLLQLGRQGPLDLPLCLGNGIGLTPWTGWVCHHALWMRERILQPSGPGRGRPA